MSAIVFTKDALVVTFTINPSYPRKASTLAPMVITGRTGHGTPQVEIKGSLVELSLTWPERCPMSAANYWSGGAGANLINFVRTVNGTRDEWVFTDDDATTHRAFFLDVPEFAHVSKGFAGTINLGLIT